MFTKTLVFAATSMAFFAFTASDAFGWGCARSFGGSNFRGGSFSHSSATVGGFGGYAHAGSSSYTTRYGNTYNTSHASTAHYGYGGAAYGGAVYHTGGYGAYHYGGACATGYGAVVYHPPVAAVGVAVAPIVYPPVVPVPYAAVAPIYHPYAPYAAGVYRRSVW